jgi:hypothetical protein
VAFADAPNADLVDCVMGHAEAGPPHPAARAARGRRPLGGRPARAITRIGRGGTSWSAARRKAMQTRRPVAESGRTLRSRRPLLTVWVPTLAVVALLLWGGAASRHTGNSSPPSQRSPSCLRWRRHGGGSNRDRVLALPGASGAPANSAERSIPAGPQRDYAGSLSRQTTHLSQREGPARNAVRTPTEGTPVRDRMPHHHVHA